MTEEPKTQRRRLRGVVKSDKMDKTITVTVERLVQDRRYGKYVRRKSTFMAHNPHDHARSGDLVEIESTRPLSRRKRWRLVRVLRRAAAVATAGPEAPNAEATP
ncbi:MAG: 30S ribosomal protein S17 [Candidatus Brocadiae bacterium]|nr:30S ribosomal protein S17 [Candidatus Brocadiia bacterium]